MEFRSFYYTVETLRSIEISGIERKEILPK